MSRKIPSLKKRLISIGQLDDEGQDVKFKRAVEGDKGELGHSSRKETFVLRGDKPRATGQIQVERAWKGSGKPNVIFVAVRAPAKPAAKASADSAVRAGVGRDRGRVRAVLVVTDDGAWGSFNVAFVLIDEKVGRNREDEEEITRRTSAHSGWQLKIIMPPSGRLLGLVEARLSRPS
ncbi:hypothetical protein HAX54_030034 [Datura stramonium]|uniref:Uncharacterized protein n=1 Tax=Datura stramonium TaxID=4076 RepID=A0ABS8V8E8_DATST|nr:hypothetical protein [Datura stramonium]